MMKTESSTDNYNEQFVKDEEAIIPTDATSTQINGRASLVNNKPQKIVGSVSITNEPPKVPEEREEEVVKAVPESKKSKMGSDLVYSAFKKASLIVFGYVISYIPWSFILIVIGVVSLVWLETRTNTRSKRISSKYAAISMTQDDLLKKIDELPAWVTFPDRERAEWLNEIVRQLWPNVSNYVVKLFRGPIQAKIRRKHKSFTFEDIDFGTAPPKIDGVKVYNRSATRDCIIIDFDIFYDGNCEINFSSSGAQLGRIRDFQMSVEMRVVLKPLLVKVPLIGGVQVFFLNTPDINFSLEGISGIPGLSDFIRQKIEERIRRVIVFPNKVAKRFSKSVDAAELKSLEPEGVIRVHVVKGMDLEKKDFGGTSDPYVILTVGAQERRTQVVKRCVNPRWDYWCEFVILDPTSQQLYFKLFDHDDLNEDDFLGSGSVELGPIVKEGTADRIIELEKVKHGSVHLRFTWLGLSDDHSALDAALQEYKLLKVGSISTAILLVYIDSAQSLPRLKESKKPDPYLLLRVGTQTQKSKIKKHTDDPVFEQGFVFLVTNPDVDSLYITIMDKPTDTKLDELTYNIQELTEKMNLQISKQEFFLKQNAPASKIIISLQLRILTNAKFDDDASDSSPSDTEFSRQNSVMSQKSENSSPTSEQSPVKTPSPTPITEEVQERTERSLLKGLTSTPSFRRKFINRSPSDQSNGEPKVVVGRIDLSFEYNEMRQKLIVTIYRVMNLPIKDPSDIPDPYVTLKLSSPGNSSIKHKTKAFVDTTDPVFNETFEYLLSKSEISEQRLIASVKTKKLFNYRNMIGQAVINFNTMDLKEPYRACFDLLADAD